MPINTGIHIVDIWELDVGRCQQCKGSREFVFLNVRMKSCWEAETTLRLYEMGPSEGQRQQSCL